MNLRMSTASFYKSDSDKSILVFLLEDAISDIYFSLVFCTNIHYRVQHELEIFLGGNPFALVEKNWVTRPEYSNWE